MQSTIIPFLSHFKTTLKTKKIFCKNHMHLCHLKCLFWRLAIFNFYENINEILHGLKNLVKQKNCIFSKWDSFLWLESRSVQLQSETAQKLQSKGKKYKMRQILQRGRKITKWGKKYKVEHSSTKWEHWGGKDFKKSNIYHNFSIFVFISSIEIYIIMSK